MSKNLAFFIIVNAFLIGLTVVTRKKRRLNNIILLCTTIFLVLSIVETAWRNFFKPKRPYFIRAGKSVSLIAPDGATIYHATYTTVDDSVGSNSFNHRIGFVNPDSLSPGIVFLGCSFTFGEGVDDSASLPWKAGSLTGRSTLNLGSSGYGLHHVYKIFLDRFAGRDNTGRVLVYTMIPDHVLRASGIYDWSSGPSFRLVGDSLIYCGSLPPISHKTAWYSSFFGCFSFIKDMVTNLQNRQMAKSVPTEEYRKAWWMIRKMDQYSRRTGGHFVLIFWDNVSEPGDPNRYYRQLLMDRLDSLSKDGIDIIRVSDIFDVRDPKYYIPNEGHPNAMAYDTVAKYLVRHLNSQK